MKIKEIKIINQDESTEVADIGADAINVDYKNTTVKAELDRLNTTNNSLLNTQTNQGNTLTSLQSQVSSLASGSPAGVYSTSSALASADPDHSKIYLVTENGNWYYYNTSTSSWTAGGIYQGTEIDSNELLIREIFFDINNFYSISNLGQEYFNYSDFINGAVNSTTGETNTSVTYRICEENIHVYNKPIKIYVKPSFRFLVLFYNNDNTFTHDGSGWITSGYYVLPAGQKHRITIARQTEDGTETADILTFLSQIYYDSFLSEKLKDLSLIVKYNEINVDINGQGDFTSLKSALESISGNNFYNRFIVNILPGTYDIASYYNSYSNNGLMIPDFTILKGIGDKNNIVLKAELVSQNTQWSPINMQNWCEIHNLTITSTNCRYTVHDDFQDREYSGINHRIIKDCNIVGIRTGYGAVYGSGYKGNAEWLFENCIIDGSEANADGSSGACILLHNNINSSKSNFVTLKNCRLLTTPSNSNKYIKGLICGTLSNNALNSTSYVTLIGTLVNKFSLYESNPSEYGSGILFYVNGFGNKNFEHQIVNSDGNNYENHIDLI